jgi:hypothetical protein
VDIGTGLAILGAVSAALQIAEKAIKYGSAFLKKT